MYPKGTAALKKARSLVGRSSLWVSQSSAGKLLSGRWLHIEKKAHHFTVGTRKVIVTEASGYVMEAHDVRTANVTTVMGDVIATCVCWLRQG